MKNNHRDKEPSLKSAILFAMLACMGWSGCFRLDSTLYNPNSDLSEYTLPDVEERDWWDFRYGPENEVPDSLVRLLTLESKTADEPEGTTIYAAYLGQTSRIARDTVILYLHGNGGNLDLYWHRIRLLANVGGQNRFGVLAIDYRGYGLSEGTPTEEGLYADTEAAIEWLKGMGLSGDRLVMYGYSMGTAPATELTANPRGLVPGWLCLEAPFASAEMMAQAGTGLTIPGSFVSNLKIDNADEIKKVNQPFFWTHGTDDDYIDYESHGQVVWNNYQGVRGVAVPVQGADHGNVPGTLGQAEYKAKLLAFIEGK